MTYLESTEINFLNTIHEVTTKASELITIYVETAATIAALSPDSIPNQEEAYELATTTAMVLTELKVTIVSLAEHSSEMNDKVQSILERLNPQQD